MTSSFNWAGNGWVDAQIKERYHLSPLMRCLEQCSVTERDLSMIST